MENNYTNSINRPLHYNCIIPVNVMMTKIKIHKFQGKTTQNHIIDQHCHCLKLQYTLNFKLLSNHKIIMKLLKNAQDFICYESHCICISRIA